MRRYSQRLGASHATVRARFDEAAYTCPMNGVWQSLDTCRELTADFAFLVISGQMLMIATGKQYEIAEDPTQGTILLGEGIISLGSSAFLRLTTSSGCTVLFQRVAMRKISTLFDMQGHWEQWEHNFSSRQTLLIEGLVWHHTFNHRTNSGVLRFNNGSVAIEDSHITISARGKLRVKDQSNKVVRFTRQANTSNLSAIPE